MVLSLGPLFGVWNSIPYWVYCLVASLANLHLVMAALIFLPGRLAPRLFTLIFRAIFCLLRKMSEVRCLSKWRSDIQTALDEQVEVSVG